MLSPGGFKVLPPVVKNLLIINGLFFLAKISLANGFGIDLDNYLGLKYFGSDMFRPYQLITYMFMHGDFTHILFNMFALWMFGSAIENFWGAKRFLFFYLFTGIGAGLAHYAVYYFQINPIIESIDAFLLDPSSPNLQFILSTHKFRVDDPNYPEIYQGFQQFDNAVKILQSNSSDPAAIQTSIHFLEMYRSFNVDLPSVVGASGAVFGILLAFGMMFPNVMIYLYFFIPVKAKWFVMGYGAIELYMGVTGTADGIAHFAHLGGMLFGLFLILYWRKRPGHKFFN